MDERTEATEHLRAIRQMMEQTRRRGAEDNWIPFVIWGVGGFVAAVVSQALASRARWDLSYIPRNLYWPSCLIVTFWLARGRKRRPDSGGFCCAHDQNDLGGGRNHDAPGVVGGVAVLAAGARGRRSNRAAGRYRMLCHRCDASGAGAVRGGGPWWVGGLAILAWPLASFTITALLFAFGYLLPAYVMRRQAFHGELLDAPAV